MLCEIEIPARRKLAECMEFFRQSGPKGRRVRDKNTSHGQGSPWNRSRPLLSWRPALVGSGLILEQPHLWCFIFEDDFV